MPRAVQKSSTPNAAAQPNTLGIRRVTAGDLKIKSLVYGNPGAGKTTLALTSNDHLALSPALGVKV